MELLPLIFLFLMTLAIWSMGTTLDKIEKHLEKIASYQEPNDRNKAGQEEPEL